MNTDEERTLRTHQTIERLRRITEDLENGSGEKRRVTRIQLNENGELERVVTWETMQEFAENQVNHRG